MRTARRVTIEARFFHSSFVNMARQNLLSLFDGFLQAGKDIAVVERRGYRRHANTYAEIAASASFRCHGLAAHGIVPGDRVMLWGPNSADWIACFWAILLRGAVVVPMDAAASLDFVRRTIQEAGVKLLMCDPQMPEIAPRIPAISYRDSGAAERMQNSAAGNPPDPGNHSTGDTIAEILFTSGTTGEPRGVVLTHGNFLANIEPLEKGIEPYRKYERWFHPLRFVSLVPLSHVFGQFMALFVPPLLGATVVLEPSNQPADVIRTIKRERATALFAVPRMLEVLRNGLEREVEAQGKKEQFARDFERAEKEKFLRRASRFRTIHRKFGWKFWAFISGGAALPAAAELFFKRLGYAVVQGYGMTETASLISLNHPFHAAEGSVGKILPGREFKLAEDGEILVRGGNVSAGYWEKGRLRPAEEQGWLRTGDLGEVDGEGNLRFRGRKKGVIVTAAGLNIFPEDLEAVLRKQPGVRDCVVVPLERDGNAEPCAVLLLAMDDELSGKQAVETANSSLAEYQRMRSWVVWPDPDFPRTPTGKPRIAAIVRRSVELLGAPEGALWSSNAPSSLMDLLSRFAAPDSSSSNAPLSSLSSLDRVELLSALEQRYNVELNETEFADAQTLADVRRLLGHPSAARSEYRYPRWPQSTPVRWLRLAIYYALAWPATQILGHPGVLGRENLANVRGPVIFISNHVTRLADAGLIIAALPARYRHRVAVAMGAETLKEFRHPPKKWFFGRRWIWQAGYVLLATIFNVFPLPRFSGFRESFRFAGESVDRGYSLLIFPEGRVNDSEDGRLAPFQSGIGLLAGNLNIPVVPMRMDGVWQMKRERRHLARQREITIRIGSPVTYPSVGTSETFTRMLEERVRAL
jgi:long-chain acyl-CoA synthetase